MELVRKGRCGVKAFVKPHLEAEKVLLEICDYINLKAVEPDLAGNWEDVRDMIEFEVLTDLQQWIAKKYLLHLTEGHEGEEREG